MLTDTWVRFVEARSGSAEGFLTRGEYQMTVPPRKGETVTLRPTPEGELTRYTVFEVIHHLPLLDSPPDEMVNECEVVIGQVVTEQEREQVIGSLCARAGHRKPRLRVGQHEGHAEQQAQG